MYSKVWSDCVKCYGSVLVKYRYKNIPNILGIEIFGDVPPSYEKDTFKFSILFLIEITMFHVFLYVDNIKIPCIHRSATRCDV